MINVFKDVINNTIIFDNKDKFNENTVNLIFLGKFSNLDYLLNKKNICTNKLFDDKNIVDKNIGKFFIINNQENTVFRRFYGVLLHKIDGDELGK